MGRTTFSFRVSVREVRHCGNTMRIYEPIEITRLETVASCQHCFLCVLPCIPMVVRVLMSGMMILLWSNFYSAKHENLLSKQTVFLINPLHTLMRTTSLAKLSDLPKSTLYLLIACALPKCSLFLWRLVVPGYRRYESFCASQDCIIIFAYDYVLYATMKGFGFYVFRGGCLWHLLAVAVIRWPVFSSCHDASSRQTTTLSTNPKKYQEIMLFWRVLTRYVILNDHRYVCRMCVLYAVLGHFRRDKVGCWMLETIQNDTKRQVVPLPARRARERSGWLSSQWHSASWHPAKSH